MDNRAKAGLEELVKRHGPSVISNEQRCNALLLDYCSDYRPEYAALVGALREGVPASLLSPPPIPKNIFLLNLSKRLEDNLNITKQAAIWAVETWAAALGEKVEGPPEAPKDLKAVASKEGIRLTWQPVSGATQYNIKRSDPSGGPATTIGPAKTSAYLDATAKPNATYFYVVSSVGLGGESENSGVAKVTARGGKKRRNVLAYAIPIGLAIVLIIYWIGSSGPTLDSLQFFEAGSGQTAQEVKTPAQRTYQNHFRRDQARYVYFSIRLKDPVAKPARLQTTWHPPQGQDVTSERVIDAGSYGTTTGLGGDTPGSLQVGDYKVELILDGSKLGEGVFTIDPPPALDISAVRLYTVGADLARKSPYGDHFFKGTTQYLHFEIDFSRLALERTTIQVVWNLPGRSPATEDYTVDAGKNQLAEGLGWKDSSNWNTGPGSVDFLIGGQKVKSATFSIDAGTYIPNLKAYAGPIQFYRHKDEKTASAAPNTFFFEDSSMRCVDWEVPLAYQSDAGSSTKSFSILSIWYRRTAGTFSQEQEIHRYLYPTSYESSLAGKPKFERVYYCPDSKETWPSASYRVALFVDNQQIASGTFVIGTIADAFGTPPAQLKKKFSLVPGQQLPHVRPNP
jgi:hypothetical protein